MARSGSVLALAAAPAIFAVGGRSSALDLLQAARLSVRFDLGHLIAQLFLTLLRFLELLGEVLDLGFGLLGAHRLLVGSGELMTQILAVGAELIALAGNLLQLLGEIRLIGVLRRLCGELIDLRGKAFNLVLQLFILSGKRLIVRLGFLELRLCSLCGLIRLGDLRRRLFACTLRGGGLERLVLLLQGLHLCSQIGNLRVQRGDIRAECLRGLTTCNSLLAQSLHGFGYLIEEVIDLVDIVPFLEAHRLEGVLPNILWRQKSHYLTTSLWDRPSLVDLIF